MTHATQSNRKMQYFLRADDGTFLYISADSDPFTYESFKLFIGDGATMRELPVREVQRFRDGGTTYVFTDQGAFHSPSRFSNKHPKELPSWSGSPLLSGLTKVETDDYDVVETDEGVTITKK